MKTRLILIIAFFIILLVAPVVYANVSIGGAYNSPVLSSFNVPKDFAYKETYSLI